MNLRTVAYPFGVSLWMRLRSRTLLNLRLRQHGNAHLPIRYALQGRFYESLRLWPSRGSVRDPHLP